MALTDDLVSYWKLDESSGNASDSVGSNTLTNNNSTAYATGKLGNGIDLEASSSQWLSCADSASLSITGNMTFGAWVKMESQPATNGKMTIASKFFLTNGRSYIFAYGDAGGTKKLFTTLSSNGTSDVEISTNCTLENGTWYYVSFVYTAASGRVDYYVNGTNIGNNTGLPTSIYDSATDFRIGTVNKNATASTLIEYFDGMIDEVGVWSRALSSTEVTTLYNSGAGLQYPFASGPANLKSYNQVAKASIKTIDGVAIASVKSVDGVA